MSQRELATAHGVARRAVQKWLADPRWVEAGFSVRGPWSAADIQRQKVWRGEQLQADPAGGSTKLPTELGRAKTVAQIKLLIEREANLRVDRFIKEKEYVKRSAAEEDSAMKWRAVKTALMQLPRALRQVLADSADPAACEALLEQALRALLADFQGAGAAGMAGGGVA